MSTDFVATTGPCRAEETGTTQTTTTDPKPEETRTSPVTPPK